MTSPGEGVTVFTSPYLSAGAPAPSEAKGLIFTVKVVLQPPPLYEQGNFLLGGWLYFDPNENLQIFEVSF